MIAIAGSFVSLHIHPTPQAVREKLEDLEPELPPLPEGETEEDPDDEGWLFDSRRSYLEQLRHYKER